MPSLLANLRYTYVQEMVKEIENRACVVHGRLSFITIRVIAARTTGLRYTYKFIHKQGILTGEVD